MCDLKYKRKSERNCLICRHTPSSLYKNPCKNYEIFHGKLCCRISYWETWFEGIKLQLTEDVVTNLQYQIEKLKDSIKELQDMIDVVDVNHVDIIINDGNWINQTGKDITVLARCFGGGGGYNYGGGGGGYMSTWTGKISKGEQVPITIGSAGSGSTNGGTTSFGIYVSATGGSCGNFNGGDGGSGGGGYGGLETWVNSVGAGGNATYGGGGGGGGGHVFGTAGQMVVLNGMPGGSGGIYGGGGGGGGGGAALDRIMKQAFSGIGGSSGINGGNGGTGGDPAIPTIVDGEYIGYNGHDGISGISGINTNYLDIEFKGSGQPGTYGVGASPDRGNAISGGSGGGGGGGGYGGSGGNGGNGALFKDHPSYGSIGGGGGGGGGYGANGADATNYLIAPSGGFVVTRSHGGGGGGYGGHANGEGGGGYGVNNYGCGGGKDISINPAKHGVCIVTYVTKEIIVS